MSAGAAPTPAVPPDHRPEHPDMSTLAAERRLAIAKMFAARLVAESPCRFLTDALKRELACSRTVTDSVVVVGGYDGTHAVRSVLVLDEHLGRWRMLPDLPIAVSGARVAEGREVLFLPGSTQFWPEVL